MRDEKAVSIVELDKIFSVKNNRVLRNDFTVMHEGKLYQIEEKTRAKEVTVEERIDGCLFIMDKGKTLRYRSIERRPERIKPSGKVRAPYILSKDNPWRNFRLPGSFPQLKQTETFLNV